MSKRGVALIAVLAAVAALPACTSSIRANYPGSPLGDQKPVVREPGELSGRYADMPLLYDDGSLKMVEYHGKQIEAPWLSLDSLRGMLPGGGKEMTDQTILDFLAANPEMAMLKHMLDYQDSAIYRLAMLIPPSEQVVLAGPGSLLITLAGDDGNVEVQDKGIIVPRQYPQATEWGDSSRSRLTLSDRYTKGLEDGEPLLLYVRIPKEYEGDHVVKVAPTDKLQGPEAAQGS